MDRTVDIVVMVVVVGCLTAGLLSMLVGWVVRSWDRFVNYSQAVMSPAPAPIAPDDADGRTDGPSASAIDPWVERLEVDRTKTAVIEVLVYSGWKVDEIRAVIKGANADIGAEVEAARQRLGIDSPERTLRVRDQAGERVITF